MTKNTVYDIIIAGGGASGLMAAAAASGNGASVLVLEQKDIPGKKILATGNGRCNFTNSKMDSSCFYGSFDLFHSIYPRMDNKAVLAYFKEIGIYPKERGGYYYPNSDQALSVQKALEQKARSSGACILCAKKITDIKRGSDFFTVFCSQERFYGRKVLAASGLKASPKLGSDGSLLPVLQKLGHHFTPLVPSLCGFTAKGLSFKQLSGVRVRAKATLLIDGFICGEDTGEVQMTDYGISGIPVFQISSPASRALIQGKKCIVSFNFLPDMTKEEILQELSGRRQLFSQQTTDFLLNGLLPSALAGVLCTSCAISAGDLCCNVPDRKYEKLADTLAACPVVLTAPRGFEYAQVCSGGVCTKEINIQTLESRIVPGLYFSGEILDVDGICGGYNLQWAWSSGYAAGFEMSRQKVKR